MVIPKMLPIPGIAGDSQRWLQTDTKGEKAMKIDIYTHWWPKKAAQTLLAKAKPDSDPISLNYLKQGIEDSNK